MFKTLKGRISLVYFCLMLLIAVVGAASVLNLFKLSKTIDGLLSNNYKSINALNTMSISVEQMNNDILLYLETKNVKDMENFKQHASEFTQNSQEEYKNIHDDEEKALIEKIEQSFKEYLNRIAFLNKMEGDNKDAVFSYIHQKVLPQSLLLKTAIEDLSSMNENAMIENKKRATQNAQNSMYVILLLSICAVFISFFISKFFTNRFLRPIYTLTQSIKRVKAGNFHQKAYKESEALSKYEELRELEHEFYNMTQRLMQYEKSTLGKLISEKNKSVAMVMSISEPIIVLDKSLKIELVNHAFERIFKVKEVNVLHCTLFEAMKDRALMDLVAGFMDSEETLREKMIHMKVDREEFYFNVIITKFNALNNVSGMIIIYQNVTQLKQLERMKTDFIGTVSHEFKTPLTSIMMGTSLMLDQCLGPMGEKQMEIMEAIKEDGERLTDLVNHLLELTRVESSKTVFKIRPCSMNEIIINSIKPMYKIAEQKDVQLSFEEKEGLPDVQADFERITWVINNLVSNALKYTHEGDNISIRASVKDKKMIVSVKDTGVGIPKEFQEKIFDKFVQVKGHDLEVRGTGLGLAIVKEIVEAHGGEIWCESKLDMGSTFTFILPLSK